MSKNTAVTEKLSSQSTCQRPWSNPRQSTFSSQMEL